MRKTLNYGPKPTLPKALHTALSTASHTALHFAMLLALLTLLALSLVSCDYTYDLLALSDDNVNYSYTLKKDPATGKVYCPDADYVICLEKDPDKDFVILNLADVQERNPSASNLKAIIDELVNSTNPDLITLTGDQSYGSATTIRQLAEILESYEIPWAPIFGNHEHNEEETSVEAQCALYESFEHCLFKTGPNLGTTRKTKSTGVKVSRGGNYVINIVENSQDSFTVVKTLVFLDTGDQSRYLEDDTSKKTYNNGTTYDRVLPEQVKFYNQVVDSAQRYGSKAQAALFIHIPIFEYVEAIGAALKTNISVYNVSSYLSYTSRISYTESSNSDLWNEGYKNSYGVMHERICCITTDDGVFDQIRENTDLIICGHDHVNSFVIDYKDVTFCFAMKTGPGCYYEEGMSGGTIITIAGNGETSVRHQIVNQ